MFFFNRFAPRCEEDNNRHEQIFNQSSDCENLKSRKISRYIRSQKNKFAVWQCLECFWPNIVTNWHAYPPHITILPWRIKHHDRVCASLSTRFLIGYRFVPPDNQKSKKLIFKLWETTNTLKNNALFNRFAPFPFCYIVWCASMWRRQQHEQIATCRIFQGVPDSSEQLRSTPHHLNNL